MNTLTKALKSKDIRNKILFTLFCITLFRIGSVIPLPIVNTDLLKESVGNNQFLSMYEFFSGGSLSQLSLFALGISPYITASIVLNLLTYAVPSLERLSQDGEIGKRKIKRYTKLLGITMGFIQSLMFLLSWFRPFLIKNSIGFIVFSAILLTLGVFLLTLMDDAISKKGIGNGSSIIICSSILSKLPKSISSLISSGDKQGIAVLVLLGILMLIMLVIAIQEATRKVQINYARHSVSSSGIATQKSYLPLKINQSGITPVIFAQTILLLPQMLSMILPENIASKLAFLSDPNTLAFNFLLSLLIVFFNYFYTSLAFDVDKLADNLKKANGFISGVRPGEQTADYLGKIMTRLVFVGSIFLIFITLLPTLVNNVSNIAVSLLGTSLLIITSTVISIIKQIKSMLVSATQRSFFDL